MKILAQIAAIGILIIVFSCKQAGNNKSTQATTNNAETTKDSLTIPANKKLTSIVFGRFCGMCVGECATMYKLDIVNNKLLVDHTDSYWEYRRGTPMKFDAVINDEKKLLIAKQFLDSIPEQLLHTDKAAERFGCPDCTDGCGIFVETKCDTTTKMFLIDYQTSQLSGEIKLFAERLKRIIGKL
ncbi:hypothetical protein [Ferruginibacter sp.]